MPVIRPLLALLLLVVASPTTRAEDELERIERELERARQVNEGAPRFVPAPGKAVHEHHTRVLLDEAAFQTGVVTLEQCHVNLDPVPATAIVYNAERLQEVRIVARQGIGRAWVDGHQVELREVRPQARICLLARTRSLEPAAGGGWQLRAGPFMRKFLDGYYPMRVKTEILYPGHRLRLTAQEPSQVAGLNVRESGGRLSYDAWFEGRLNIALTFTVQ